MRATEFVKFWPGSPLPLPASGRWAQLGPALNSLGPSLDHEKPDQGDSDFSARVAKWQKETGASEIEATFLRVLQEAPGAGEETMRLIEGARRRVLQVGTDPKSAWLGALAARRYGPKGPRVEEG